MVSIGLHSLSPACSLNHYHSVVHEAWKAPYVSDYPNFLLDVLVKMKCKEKDGAYDYNNSVSIIQSSGTGKSRMVDEAARLVFALPFNLRAKCDNTGERRFLPS